MLTASEDTTIALWDLETGEEQLRLRGHQLSVMGLGLSAEGRHLAIANIDRTVRLRDLKTGGELLRLEHPLPVSRLLFVPDGSGLITGAPVDGVRRWDLLVGALQWYHRTWELPRGITADGKQVLLESSSLRLADGDWHAYAGRAPICPR